MILLFCLIGVYSVGNSIFDLYVMALFGGVGYLMRKFGYEAAPLVLAFVIGPVLEQALHQSLLIFQGSFMIFVTRPISAVALGIVLLLLSNLLPYFKKYRKEYEKFEE
ncbi:MAG TPA: tripartite tricarboxylate transporter permease [Methylomirabilota bacterium]|nr:tripartite tricarboxylate transporter permease [Methylomirabilota bacterium]